MKTIKVAEILEGSHSLMNEVVVDTARHLNDAVMVFKLDDLLKERGLTQKDLSNMTGMRVGTISDLVNGKGISFNKVQLLAIMVALRITDMNEIFEIRLPNNLDSTYKKDTAEWISNREMPISVKEMYKKNVLATTLGDK